MYQPALIGQTLEQVPTVDLSTNHSPMSPSFPWSTYWPHKHCTLHRARLRSSAQRGALRRRRTAHDIALPRVAMPRVRHLLLAAACLAAAAPRAIALSTLHTGALVDGLKRYEVVTPFAIQRARGIGDGERHPASFSLSLTAFGREYHLELRRHEELLAAGYGEWESSPDGSVRKLHATEAGSDVGGAAGAGAGGAGGENGGEHGDGENANGGHCYYHGRLSGGAEDGSVVALSICDGVRGQIFTSTGTLSLEPAHRHVAGQAAPRPGPGGDLLATSIMAFRPQDEKEGFRPPAHALREDVERAALDLAAGQGVDLSGFLGGGALGDMGFLAAAARLTARSEDGTTGGSSIIHGGNNNLGEVEMSAGQGLGDATSTAGGRKLAAATLPSDIYLELLVVNDHSRCLQYGADTATLHADSIHVVNVVASLFKGKFTPNLNLAGAYTRSLLSST
jgi:hypothetical protein